MAGDINGNDDVGNLMLMFTNVDTSMMLLVMSDRWQVWTRKCISVLFCTIEAECLSTPGPGHNFGHKSELSIDEFNSNTLIYYQTWAHIICVH